MDASKFDLSKFWHGNLVYDREWLSEEDFKAYLNTEKWHALRDKVRALSVFLHASYVRRRRGS